MITKEELIQKAMVRSGHSNSKPSDSYASIMNHLIDIVREELPDSCEIREQALNNDEKDFDQWWWEMVYKHN